ncbi:K02A2.6-like [Cordylochernes scorpioides]|uniref:RNA-directed DNA polymerase n=1 Tax=Cordylochernes scorpioides TaxID=51811 RepID=A0ABY6L684_9ARAC|nr:K02A2.6-like [Cordylochernes scorpioides]
MAVFLADGMKWRYKRLVGPPLLVEGYADPHVLTSLWLHRHSYKSPHFLVPTIFSTVGAPWTHQGVYQLRFDVWTNLPLFSQITMPLVKALFRQRSNRRRIVDIPIRPGDESPELGVAHTGIPAAEESKNVKVPSQDNADCGKTVNAEFYKEVFRRLHKAVKRKRQDLAQRWRLHHDNAPAHTTFLVTSYLTQIGVEVMPQTPYSPDMSSPDSFLFPKSSQSDNSLPPGTWGIQPCSVVGIIISRRSPRLQAGRRAFPQLILNFPLVLVPLETYWESVFWSQTFGPVGGQSAARCLLTSEVFPPVGMMLKTVTGDTSPILGGLDVEICLGGIRFNHRVLVAEIDDEFILGMDILTRQDFTFDPTQGVLTLGSESFVLSKEGQKDEEVRLFACEDKHIDGNSEGVVRAVAEEPLGCCIGLAEPTDNSAKNLLVARTLVNIIHGKVPVRVANVFFSGVSIIKGDLLATCTPISRISTKEDGQHKIIRQTKLELDLKDLSEEEARNARAFLKKNQDVFSSGDGNLGRTDLVRHRINTGDARPIRQSPRRLPMAKQEEVTGLLRKMKRDGIIEESNGPWSSPVVLVTKKDGTTRFCVDYRRLNDITKKDSYPLPRIDDTLTTLAVSSWFSTLDLKSGYWQVGMHPEDKEKTAFSTGSGLYQFTVMPFGLCNAPATFERLIELVLKGLTWKTCLVYLDDIMVMGRTFEEHLRNLQEVFDRFRANNLTLNPKKCQLFQKSVKFLGHIVSTEGIRTSEDKIFAIKNWPEPGDKHELRSFLGLCTYYRRFVEGYADIAVPLHRLTEARASFHWNEECEKAFRALKRSLCSNPILAYPQPGTNFILDTDASNLGIGGVLSQVQDEDERVIEFFSRVLTKAERNYCATRKELLAIVKAVEHFHKYLYGQNFLIRTDHAALTWLLRMKNPEGQVARWLEKLQQYHFQIKLRGGRSESSQETGGITRNTLDIFGQPCSVVGIIISRRSPRLQAGRRAFPQLILNFPLVLVPLETYWESVFWSQTFRALRPHEKNYIITELECLAIIDSVEKFRIYLTGVKFTIFTDHHALQWLKTIKNPSGRLFRWSLKLSAYDYDVRYLKADQIRKHQPLRPPFPFVKTNIEGLHIIKRKGVTKIVVPPSLQHNLINQGTVDIFGQPRSGVGNIISRRSPRLQAGRRAFPQLILNFPLVLVPLETYWESVFWSLLSRADFPFCTPCHSTPTASNSLGAALTALRYLEYRSSIYAFFL